ncbi:MAG: hypothetical protein J7J92_03235 [Candidatus Aenigmarchaeota archaeon]|nr:hypothetical protein [Candidatus Aenigmarchaeota archaeon]
MLGYEKLIIIINTIIIILLIAARINWLLTISVMLILILIVIQKMWFQEKFEKSSKRQKELLEIMNDKLLDFSQKVNKIKTDINREMFIIENKLSEERVNYQKDMDMQYRDLTRKIVDIENKLNKIKKTVGAGLGITEERLNKIETELGIFTNFKEDEEAA